MENSKTSLWLKKMLLSFLGITIFLGTFAGALSFGGLGMISGFAVTSLLAMLIWNGNYVKVP